MEQIRTFISIDMPDEIKKVLKDIQKKLPEFKGKKTELDNLHLTLKFLGEIEEDKVEEVRERMKNIKIRPFEAEVKNIGVFSKNYIRIVWLYVEGPEELQKQIDELLKGLFKPEKRFMSHLTVARVKEIEDKKSFLEGLDKIEIPKIKFKVDNFRLKKSILNPEGPVYEDVEEYFL